MYIYMVCTYIYNMYMYIVCTYICTMYEEGDRVLGSSEIESMLNSDDDNAVPNMYMVCTYIYTVCMACTYIGMYMYMVCTYSFTM